MSKSLKRVRAAIEALGLETEIVEASSITKTAADAAAEAGVEVDQIAKSIIFRGGESDKVTAKPQDRRSAVTWMLMPSRLPARRKLANTS